MGGMLKDLGRALAMTSRDVVNIPELSCQNHEEADSRIFCHLHYVTLIFDCQRVVLQASDTDIVLMSLYDVICTPGLQEL